MNLSDSVRHYYFEHFGELPEDKQFHFASRLAAWQNDPEASKVLEGLRPKYIGSEASVHANLLTLINNPPAAKINAAESRQQYFDKYPILRGYMMALFRVRHLRFIYNFDARDILLAIVPLEEFRALSASLLDDPDAMRILSTYAINCIYLIDFILYPETGNTIDASHFIKLKSGYDLTKANEIQLFIYLYTHCIIGETNFYERTVSEPNRNAYLMMLKELEEVITDNYDDIHLDNKLEFLVCCLICKYDTPLFERIHLECTHSVSVEGTFLIDKVSSFKQAHKATFVHSEHRNVLFIMSCSPYLK